MKPIRRGIQRSLTAEELEKRLYLTMDTADPASSTVSPVEEGQVELYGTGDVVDVSPTASTGLSPYGRLRADVDAAAVPGICEQAADVVLQESELGNNGSDGDIPQLPPSTNAGTLGDEIQPLLLPTPGQTLLLREAFTSDLSPASPGNLGTITSTTPIETAPRGPATAESNGIGVSGSIRRVTPAEVAGPAFDHLAIDTRNTDLPGSPSTFPDKGMAFAWFWFPNDPTYQWREIFHSNFAIAGIFNPGDNADWQLAIQQSPGNYGPRFIIPNCSWVAIWWAWEFVQGVQTTQRLYAQRLGDESPTLVGETFIAPVPLTTISIRYQYTTANEFSPSGRIGAYSIYELDNLSDGAQYPADVGLPDETPLTYVIDPVTGNDANRNGPWATVEGLVTAQQHHVVLGAATPWKTLAGDDAGYATLADTAEKRAWAEAWEQEQIAANGDIIQFAPGTHRVTKKIDGRLTPGLRLIAQDPDNRPILNFDAVLSGTWSKPDSVNFPNVWKHDSLAKLYSVPYQDADRKALRAVLGSDQNAALNEMNGEAATFWTDASGGLYVHAVGSVDPNSTVWEVSQLFTDAGGGAWIIDLTNGEASDLITLGGNLFNPRAAVVFDPFIAQYHYGAELTSLIGRAGISAIRRSLIADYGKHGVGYVGTLQGSEGLRVMADVEFAAAPLGPLSGHTAYVLYSPAIGYGPVGGIVDIQYRVSNTARSSRQQGTSQWIPATVSGYFSHDNGQSTDVFALIRLVDCSYTALSYSESATLLFEEEVAPVVTGIFVRGEGWSSSYLDLLAEEGLGDADGGYRLLDGANQIANAGSITWQTINQISVTFSEDVVLDEDSLRLLNSANVDLAFADTNGFVYDSVSHTATWNLAAPLVRDKFLIVLLAAEILDSAALELDGEWTTSVTTFDTGGDGLSGGDLYFRFNYLPGDVTLNGQTNTSDVGVVRGAGTVVPDATIFRYDVTANNLINTSDVGIIRGLGTLSLAGLPEPEIPPPPRDDD